MIRFETIVGTHVLLYFILTVEKKKNNAGQSKKSSENYRGTYVVATTISQYRLHSFSDGFLTIWRVRDQRNFFHYTAYRNKVFDHQHHYQ